MKHRYSICVLILLVLCCLAMPAQAKPNFSGEWVIDLSKSDFGQFPAPYSYVRKIEHNEPNIKTITTQSRQRGENTTEITCTTDGAECVNTTQYGEITGTIKWDGDTLVNNATLDYQGMAIKFDEKLVLSADGKTLTVASHLASDMGEMDITIVLNKK